MKKVINPAICQIAGSTRTARAYACIKYENGNLSISGVIGPLSNGNCRGSCGQCSEEIAAGTPAEGWTAEMLEKFIAIWDRWHLNDMRATCEHQRDLGWENEASQEVTVYRYRLTSEASDQKKQAENAALEALRKGETFTPSKEQVMFATLPYTVESYGEELDSPYYEPKKQLYAGDRGATEIKTRGFVNYDDTPLGILCKPCPVCGYKYGTSWHREEVPQEVIDWLFSLPVPTTDPAWV